MAIAHPASHLDLESLSRLRNNAFEAENKGELHEAQLNEIYLHNWFKMFMPKSMGGLGYSLPEVLRTEEALAWADGSTAWVVTLCSGAGWFVGFLNPEVAREVFADDNVCFAGSGAITGTANRTNDFYELSGYWKYATGAHHATVFTVNCIVKENGQPLYNEDKTPLVYSFLLKRNEVTIHDTWHCMGMVATGSHAIEVKSLRVPLNRSFIIDP